MSNVEGQPLISTKGSTYPISPQILISTEYYLDLLAKSPNTDFEILKHTFLELLGCFSNHLARHLVHSHHLSLRFSYFRNGAIAVSIIQQLLHNPIQSPLISISVLNRASPCLERFTRKNLVPPSLGDVRARVGLMVVLDT
jgi:hypothetical protein